MRFPLYFSPWATFSCLNIHIYNSSDESEQRAYTWVRPELSWWGRSRQVWRNVWTQSAEPLVFPLWKHSALKTNYREDEKVPELPSQFTLWSVCRRVKALSSFYSTRNTCGAKRLGRGANKIMSAVWSASWRSVIFFCCFFSTWARVCRIPAASSSYTDWNHHNSRHVCWFCYTLHCDSGGNDDVISSCSFWALQVLHSLFRGLFVPCSSVLF